MSTNKNLTLLQPNSELKNLRAPWPIAILFFFKTFLSLSTIIMLCAGCSLLFSRSSPSDNEAYVGRTGVPSADSARRGGSGRSPASGAERYSSPAGAAAVELRDVPFSARSSWDAALRQRVIILPFLDVEGPMAEQTGAPGSSMRSIELIRAVEDIFARNIYRSDKFVLISPLELPQEVKQFVQNGIYNLEALAPQAASLGVSSLIEGRILRLKAKRLGEPIGLIREVKARLEAEVALRMIATKNAKIVFNEKRSIEIEDSTFRVAERVSSDRMLEEDPQLAMRVLSQAFQTLLPKLLQASEKINWQGRVARIKGDRVYINAGRLTGIQIGDMLKITEEGEDIHDPETGAMIGRVPGRLKGTVEVVSYFDQDGSVAVIYSGSGFKENDLVEVY